MPIGEVAGSILRGARGGGERNVDTRVVVGGGKKNLVKARRSRRKTAEEEL